jgi:hypothetical protein
MGGSVLTTIGVTSRTGLKNIENDEDLLAREPEMDRFQTGHIRHIENIAHQLPNDWAHMGTRLSWQENFEAYRYQLAYMAYAVGLTSFHRLPAAPGYVRATFDGLVQKMLLPDVWYYWRETSRGGGGANLDAPVSEGWINPVEKDNIMYSAYIQSMSVMYDYLFNDKKYAQPGALTFKFDPILFRLDERQEFVYDQNSLNDHIYWRMVESGYLGIACEPYCTFQICQQPAILAFRLHDILNGTDRAKEVTDGFTAAWREFGQIDAEGRYNTFVKTHTSEVQPNNFGPWSDGWLGALLNMWNPDLVKSHYPEGIRRWVVELPDGTAYVPPFVAEGSDISAGSALDFGWCCMWASEVGDQDLLKRFLGYADKYMSPVWKDGAYYYPRNDDFTDADGNITMVSPCTGNALLPYARLNVPDGMWGLYNRPWGRDHFDEPLINDISDNVDVLRARYFADQKKLIFTLATREDRTGDAQVVIDNIWRTGPDWRLKIDGVLAAKGTASEVYATSVTAVRRGDALALIWPRKSRADFVLSWD